jgi:tight adherence protein B
LFALIVLAGAPVALAAGIAAATAARRMRLSRERRLHQRELDGLAAALDAVIAELRVGAHPADACDAAGREAAAADGPQAPVAAAFRSASARAKLGGAAAEGFRGVPCRVSSELERLAEAWSVADAHGLPLADLLGAAHADLTARSRFASRAEAGLAGARATAGVLALLPLLGIALGQMMGAQPLAVLLGGGAGGIFLVVGVALACAGLAWSDRLTQTAVQTQPKAQPAFGLRALRKAVAQ